jgi:hypothetical protein
MKKLLTILFAAMVGFGLNGQNLDIQGQAKIHSSDTVVAVEIEGGGLLIPRMTTQERDNLTNLPMGLLILNTSNGCIEMYFGKWTPLCATSYLTREVNRLIGGSDFEEPYKISQTSDGGYIVAGFSESSHTGDVSGTNNGFSDYWIVKLNSGGGIEWDTLLGGSSSDIANSITQTSDGGYIVAGYSSSDVNDGGDVSGMNNGFSDYWIVKLNSGGDIEWDTLLGGSFDDIAYSIVQTSDGGYAVAGYSSSSATGDVSGTNNGAFDYWIVKLNSGGGIEWDTLLGGSSDDVALSIAQTSDGGYIVAGHSSSSATGDLSGTNNGSNDYWIVKLNSGGGIEWDTLLGGSSSDVALSIAQTSDGRYIVAGYSESSATGDGSGTTNGGFDFWIITLNQFGILLK